MRQDIIGECAGTEIVQRSSTPNFAIGVTLPSAGGSHAAVFMDKYRLATIFTNALPGRKNHGIPS